MLLGRVCITGVEFFKCVMNLELAYVAVVC